MSELYESTSKLEWEQARRTAFIQDVLGAFTERSVDLLPFEEVLAVSWFRQWFAQKRPD
jgi:hypothetical protein